MFGLTYAAAAAFITSVSPLTCPAEAPVVRAYPPAVMTAVFQSRWGAYYPEGREVVLAEDAGPWVYVHEVAHACIELTYPGTVGTRAAEREAQRIHHLWMRRSLLEG